MEVRFEDHPQFQRAAALAALGGGLLSCLTPLPQAAIAGSAVALALQPGGAARRGRVAAAAVCAAAAAASIAQAWLLPVSGALLVLVFAVARGDSSRAAGRADPPGWAIALSATLGAGAVLLAGVALAPLSSALAVLAPGWLATGASGAAFGLWAGFAAAPLHVALGGDAVEARLSALRPVLPPEVRGLAERAVQARRGAFDELPAGARGDWRGLLDSLALAALEVAERAASLSRSAAPSLEDELQRRFAQLTASAAAAGDDAARGSYQRAAQALEGQLEHYRRVRRARERVLARLHEEVVSLERARFSLTLLRGSDGAAELDLLHDRLQHGALAFEACDELTAPERARVE